MLTYGIIFNNNRNRINNLFFQQLVVLVVIVVCFLSFAKFLSNVHDSRFFAPIFMFKQSLQFVFFAFFRSRTS